MKPLQFALVVILSFIVAFATVRFANTYNGTAPVQPPRETAYERAIRTGTLRCGYSSWKPFFYTDPSTGEKHGIFHDLAEEIAKRYNLKIEWTAEVGWGEVVTALNAQRFDAAISGYWANTNRAKQIYFTNPVFYSKSYVWMRAGDTRKITSYEQLNDPSYSFGYSDGAAEAKIINLRFPNARKVTLPEMAPLTDVYDMVGSGKVDFIEEDKISIGEYLKLRPNTLKLAIENPPLILNPVVMLIGGGEDRLKALFDNALREIELDGTLDQILAKYDAKDLVERNVY